MITQKTLITLRATFEYCFAVMAKLPHFTGGSWKTCESWMSGVTQASKIDNTVKYIFWNRYPEVKILTFH